jgi:hypothetical protein
MSPSNFKTKAKLCLRSIDLFGVEPKLQMMNSSKYNSLLGGFVSILFYLITFLSILYFGQEIVLKESPNVISMQEKDTNSRRYNLTLDKFNFLVGISDMSFNYFQDDSIYKLSAEFELAEGPMHRVISSQFIPLRFENCDIDKHFSYFKESFEKINLNSTRCLIPEDSASIYLQGNIDDNFHTKINFYITACKNETSDGIICKSQSVIDNTMKMAYFSIHYIDTIFNPKHYDEPEKYIRKDYFTSITNLYSKNIDFYFNNIDYITDSGLITEAFNLKKFLGFEKATETVLSKKDSFLTTSFMLSDIRKITQRKYMKAQDFISHIGGFIKGIMVMLQFILHTYTNTKYFTFLINESFVFSEESLENGGGQAANNNTNNNKSVQKLQNKSTFIIENNFVNERTGQENLEILKRFQNSKKKIQVSLLRTLSLAFCRRCKHIPYLKFFDKGKEKIRNNINIVRLINLSEEIEILKEIFFDEKSRGLIDFMMENRKLNLVGKKMAANLEEVNKYYNDVSCIDAQNYISHNLKDVFDKTFSLNPKDS